MRALRAVLVGILLGPGWALAASPPVIDALNAPASILPDATATISAQVHSDDTAPLAYEWTTTGGQIAGTGPGVTFTAPATYGKVTVTLTVTGAGGTATKSATIGVALATFRGSLKHDANAMRIASAPTGEMYVLDGVSGDVSVLTRRGDLKGTVRLPERALSVAPGPGHLFVAVASGRLAKVDPASGKVLGTIDLQPPVPPVAMAWDGTNRRLWMVDRAASAVRVVSPEGTPAFTITTAAGARLRAPIAVAIDRVGAIAWVAVQSNETGNAVHAYDLNGGYIRSALPFGSDLGKVTRIGGVGVDASGNAWVTDMFQGVVQTVSRAGQPVSIVGRYGSGPGDLRQPSDATPMANGDVVVASSDRGKLERYGRGAALPVCTGDSDCDGIPDSWELAHGMNPNSAADAWLDPDGNGLTNEQEYQASIAAAQTSGTTTLASTRTSTTMTSVTTPVASLVASPVQSDPGLVSLSATLTSTDPCTVSWKQVSGPPVALRGATTLAPAFVARAAGTYRFACTAACGATSPAPAYVDASVSNVAPRPDAGRTTVVAAPADVVLDGSLSTDANADAVALRWDQVLGRPLTSGVDGPVLAVSPGDPGYFEFMLTATDARGAEATAQAPLLALAPGAAGPTAVATTPVLARAGGTVVLDASGSHAAPTARYLWTQVEGAAVTLSDATSPVATFVAPAAGRYGFDLYVQDGEVRSPATRVEAYVAPAAAELPKAIAKVTGTPALGLPLALDATPSAAGGSGPLAYTWRIVSGPAAGLTGANGAVATLVPFDSGTFVLELAVTERGMPGVPARVRVDVPRPDGTLPLALAQAPEAALVGSAVQLDGSLSTGSGPLRHRWTQVRGPWVALDDATAPRASFAAPAAGVYEFELEVLDGKVRSAPARVRVAVDDGAAR